MKVFITGISGFVGAGLARSFLADGVEVHGLVRPSSNLWRLEDIKDSLHLHVGDLLDEPSIRKALTTARPDVLFHLAAYGVQPMQKDTEMLFRSTLFSTMKLLDCAKDVGVGMCINTGSSSEYGTKDHPMREDEILEPNTPYAMAKALQTLYCQWFAKEEILPVITLRLFSVYGPYEEATRFVSTLVTKALKHEDIPLANPTNARDFVYIDDVIDAYRAAATKPQLSGQIFNVGSGVQSTLQEAFDLATHLSKSTSKPLFGEYKNRTFDTTTWVADMSKTHTQLGIFPKFSLEDGLQATIDWMRKSHVHGK